MIDLYPAPMRIEGTFYVPEGAPRPEYIIPDEIVEYMAQRFGLLLPNVRGIDPLCGTGTIPRVINGLGGCCDGVEQDRQHYDIARTAVSPGWLPVQAGYPDADPTVPYYPINGTAKRAGEIVLGDCTKVATPNRTRLGVPYPYHYIYTSIPFNLILDENLDSSFALTFDRMLMPGGLLIIDSADEAVRDGRVCNPAEATIRYFARHGYFLRGRFPFRTLSPGGCDDQFTEMVFMRAGEF